MKNKMSLLVLSVLLTAGPALALNITVFDSADNLAQSLVGSGVTISNVSYTGAHGASGYFTGGTAAGLGFNSGIVLTTGAANNLEGNLNTSDAISTSNGFPGDTYLTSLLGPGYITYDAAILSFDFVSASDSIYFNYIFGSDEYNVWVNSSYNDV
ncbi:MAG: choice-of-anchor L domain-containing protein [Desulfuromonadaceae bacterium]|nr:choice-of-anchor L domain-containing protein [Desulfuromonas sp.]MDY0184241.1 choice-of-anchor L domain-containing protein [Desulfuromonadaceae bacterium]